MQTSLASHADKKLLIEWPFEILQVKILYANTAHLRVGGWRVSDLLSGYWRIYMNHGPGASLVTRDESIEMVPGRVYLVPAFLEFSGINSQPFTQTYIHFSITTTIPGVLNDLFAKPFCVPDVCYLERSMMDLYGIIGRSGSADLISKSLANSITFHVLAASLDLLPAEMRDCAWARFRQVDQVLPAIDVLDRSLSKEYTNVALAKLCGMSEDHFIRKFRTAVGMPPAKYLLKRRLNAAAEKLHFSEDSIEQIAQQTGFCDRSYFSRAFAKSTGLPPAAYRRRTRIAEQRFPNL